jgi:hypothetical protein
MEHLKKESTHLLDIRNLRISKLMNKEIDLDSWLNEPAKPELRTADYDELLQKIATPGKNELEPDQILEWMKENSY